MHASGVHGEDQIGPLSRSQSKVRIATKRIEERRWRWTSVVGAFRVNLSNHTTSKVWRKLAFLPAQEPDQVRRPVTPKSHRMLFEPVNLVLYDGPCFRWPSRVELA